MKSLTLALTVIIILIIGIKSVDNNQPDVVTMVPDFSPDVCVASTATPKTGVLGLAALSIAEPEAMEMVDDLGVQLVRVEFRWDQIEPVRGEYNWERFDRVIKNFHYNGVEVLATINHVPAWAYSAESLTVDFEIFLENFLGRYGNEISLYEIFNEPNLPGYGWPFSSDDINYDAKLYASVLVKANEIIRQQNPEALIMIGGLSPDNDPGVFIKHLYEYVNPLCYDIFSFHPYGRGASLVEVQQQWNDFLAENGDVDKPIWFAEFGTNDDATAEEVLLQVDAQLPQLGGVVWFSLRDLRPIGWNFGLVEYNWTKKPVYEKFKEVVEKH
jgi:hypothetical protein